MDKLTIYEFGQQLLDTNDLDPTYVLIHHSNLKGETLRKFLLSYWNFYHIGTASWITSQPDYFNAMMKAAKSKDYPRSSERRHFRGANAIKAVEYQQQIGVGALFDPFKAISTDTADAYSNVVDVVKYIKTWVGYGDWISFKVADMLERLGLARIAFDIDTVMYSSPQEAAELLYEIELPMDNPEQKVGDWAINRIMNELRDNDAPPRYERKINMQEAETILCKWKSYYNGHYHVGEDVAACRKGLLRFPKVRLCQDLIKAGKSGGLW